MGPHPPWHLPRCSITFSLPAPRIDALHRNELVGLDAEAPDAEQDALAGQAELLEALAEEVARLRKAVLRQGHAQELFQARVEEAVGRLAAHPGDGVDLGDPGADPSPHEAGHSMQPSLEVAPASTLDATDAPAGPPPAAALGPAQTRALLELDQALLSLLRLANGAEAASALAAGAPLPGLRSPGEAAGATSTSPAPTPDSPRSLREGLALLQVRVRNLQHSMGLEAIPALGRPFDDRWHEACGIASRPDLPDGWVAEEILPGYRLGERVVRPARVVVNRRA